ncbi:class I SAM-dependent methyltransferase [Dictyobacter aurantiacus]|uniref:Methyltransferase type 11 domain-containing protein n=1 Tax=Dictyobacter aurantiacus TaxID=1936993 RepID=A0A401Z8R5_9CHLR|nr:class I SAM-dependent methyltransferase [Dictyobacter aurantiacus]GCE03260.1 hypothetical protein KDAU_05890 [Dictyobacter aurantiacus]
MNTEHTFDATEVKACCALAYQSDAARLLLGDSFHPGGIQLTEYLGSLLRLEQGHRVLDVASGQGASAIALARRFGCQVLGIEYGAEAVRQASRAAVAENLAHLVTFQQGDAEHLPVPDNSFDALICECAFCTFPNKTLAALEFQRVLKPTGQLGLNDLTCTGAVPEDLQDLLAWIACIADAQPVESYIRYLEKGGLNITRIENHDSALHDMVEQIQGKLLGTELLLRLRKVELPASFDIEQAKRLARAAKAAIQSNTFGYVTLLARKEY